MVLVIKPQSEHLSPRVGSECCHEEPSSRNKVSIRRPCANPSCLSKALLEHRQLWRFWGVWSMAAFLKQNWVLPTGNIYTLKSQKYLLCGSLQKKNCDISPRPPTLSLEQPVAKIPVVYKLEIEKIYISIQQCQLIVEFSIQHSLQFKNMGKITVLLTVPGNI